MSMKIGKALVGAMRLVFWLPRSKKWRTAYLGVLAVVFAYAGILTFPGALFAYYHEQGTYRVWSDEPIDPAITSVLDRAEGLLKRSAIHDPNMVHRLYVCNNKTRMRFVARGDMAFGVTYLMRHNTFLSRAEVPADKIFRGASDQAQRPLSSVIAHERIHALLLSHYGLLTEFWLPTWKKEGYCEYIGGNPSFGIEEGKRLIREGRKSSSPSFRYLEYYFMVKYLLDVEHRSVDDLVTKSFDEAEVFSKARKAIDRL